MEFTASQTYKNLAAAFAGESQARTRYNFIAYGAENEGYCALAKAIREIADQEFTHARMFYTALAQHTTQTIENIDICAGYPFKERWNLVDNLMFASQNENDEASEIYPKFASIAKEEGFQDISNLFTLVANVEKCHNKFFAELHTKLKNNALYKSATPYKWKCSLCGHEHTAAAAWQICPLCKSQQGNVMLNLSDN